MPALRNILVAVKPGSLGAHPLPTAEGLAARARARLTALSVAEARKGYGGMEVGLPPGMSRRATTGIPAIEIGREAESMGADLIVLGRDTPGQVGLGHGRDTVEGTVRRARVPCLVVPRGHVQLGNVLAAVDGGPDSRDVIAAARLVARLFDRAVRIVQVEEPVLAGVGVPTRHHEPASAIGDETIVCQGDPVSEILRVVPEEDVDLLVFGHHRGGPVSTHATSGVAARLLQRAPCAVLTVPV